MKTLPLFHSHIMLHAPTVPAVLKSTTIPAKPRVRKLLKKVREFLDDDYKEHLRQVESMRNLLKKLRKRQKVLEREADSSNSANLQQRIQVVKAQRRKGLEALRTLQSQTR